MRKTIFSSIEARVLVFTIPVLILVLVVCGLSLRTFLAAVVTEQYQDLSLETSETIELSLSHSLMEDDWEEVQKIIYDTSLHESMDVVRLIGLDGVVLASSIRDEVGVSLQLESEQCQGCHEGDTAEIPAARRLPALNRTGEVLVTVRMLENRVACQSCHNDDLDRLGLILVEHSVAPIGEHVNRLELGIAGTGFAVFIVVFWFLGVVLRWQVSVPLDKLGAGEFEPAVTGRPDDIGRLASRLVDLNHDLDTRDELLDFQRKSFDVLLSILENTGKDPSVKKMFDYALVRLRETMEFESIGMRLFDEREKCFRLIAYYGISPKMLEVLECIDQNQGFQAEALRTKWPVYTSDIPTAQNLIGGPVQDMPYRSLICVPLIAGEDVQGTIELVTEREHDWQENEVRWLALFGRSIGILTRNIQLTLQLRDMSTLRERSLLAQEIHDGLAQLIGSIRLWAEGAQTSLEAEQLEEVESAIGKIEHTARDAYTSIREEMLGLRDNILPGKNFISVLTEYLKRYQRQWGIETELSHPYGNADEDKLPVSAMAEIQLLRIIQEGVTNVRRHAEATYVRVSIEEHEDGLRVSIQDNGKGFDPEKVRAGNLGLRIIHERVVNIGGSIDIQTGADQGTELQITIPELDKFA